MEPQRRLFGRRQRRLGCRRLGPRRRQRGERRHEIGDVACGGRHESHAALRHLAESRSDRVARAVGASILRDPCRLRPRSLDPERLRGVGIDGDAIGCARVVVDDSLTSGVGERRGKVGVLPEQQFERAIRPAGSDVDSRPGRRIGAATERRARDEQLLPAGVALVDVAAVVASEARRPCVAADAVARLHLPERVAGHGVARALCG